MDADVILRLLMFLVALPLSIKGAYEIFIGTRSRLREEYKFARDFMIDIENAPAMHPFVLEKGYQALAGDSRLKINEGIYLLSLRDSPRALRDFVMGRKYLEHLPHRGDLQINFKANYSQKWSRVWRRGMHLTLATVFWLLGFGPLVFSPELFKGISPDVWGPFVGGCMLVFLPNALFAMRSWACLYRAEELVKNQKRHTQRILINTHAGTT